MEQQSTTVAHKERVYHCSFCGKTQDMVRRFISAPSSGVFICNECVDFCVEIVGEGTQPEKPEGPTKITSFCEEALKALRKSSLVLQQTNMKLSPRVLKDIAGVCGTLMHVLQRNLPPYQLVSPTDEAKPTNLEELTSRLDAAIKHRKTAMHRNDFDQAAVEREKERLLREEIDRLDEPAN